MDNAQEIFDLRDIISINLWYMRFFGIMAPKNQSTFFRILHFLRAVVLMGFFFCTLMLIEFGYMYLCFGDIDKMTEGSFLTLANVLTTTVYVYIFKYRHRIDNLIDGINRKEFQPKNEKHRDILTSVIRTSKLTTLSMQVSCGTTVVFWSIYPFTLSSGPILPTVGYIPYDTTTSPSFEITFVFEFIAVLISGIMYTSALALAAGLIMVISAELNILNDCLENLRAYALEEFKLNINAPKDLEEIMKEKLKECVVHHRFILEFADEFVDIFGQPLLGQYMIVVTILCTALYQMSTVPVLSMRFFSYICFEYCVVCVLFAICYFGNHVITEVRHVPHNESTKLTDCAYNCEWTNCSQEFKQNLIIFLSRSQSNLQLFTGGIFSLSLENFLQIIKTSVSYYCVLQQLSGSENDV